MAATSEIGVCADSWGVEYAEPTSPKVRNILILGKTGVGKSTIANKIVGSQIFQISSAVDSITHESRNNIVTGKRGKDGTEYNIKLIDTVGQSHQFSNDHIIDSMKHFLESFRKGIHLVIFVLKSGRITDEDSEAFKFIINTFGNSIGDISALVVTCCEGLHEEAREALVKELNKEENTKNISGAMKKGVLPVGFPVINAVKQELQPIYEESAKKDEEKLRTLIDECELRKMSLYMFQWSAWLVPRRSSCSLM